MSITHWFYEFFQEVGFLGRSSIPIQHMLRMPWSNISREVWSKGKNQTKKKDLLWAKRFGGAIDDECG